MEHKRFGAALVLLVMVLAGVTYFSQNSNTTSKLSVDQALTRSSIGGRAYSEEVVKLRDLQTALEEATVAHNKELTKLRAAAKEELEEATVAHNKNLAKLRAAAKEELEEATVAHNKKLAKLRAAAKEELEEATVAHNKELTKLRAAAKPEMDAVKLEHTEELAKRSVAKSSLLAHPSASTHAPATKDPSKRFEEESQRVADASNQSTLVKLQAPDCFNHRANPRWPTIGNLITRMYRRALGDRTFWQHDPKDTQLKAWCVALCSDSTPIGELRRLLNATSWEYQDYITDCREGFANLGLRLALDMAQDTGNLKSLRSSLVLLDFVRRIWHTSGSATTKYLPPGVTVRALLQNATLEFHRIQEILYKQHPNIACDFPQVHNVTCPVHLKRNIATDVILQKEIARMEPIHCDLRNLLYPELKIAMTPYVPMLGLDNTRTTGGDRVLIDFGVNQFAGSPKWLADSYEVLAPFDRLVLIEPRAGRVVVPEYYTKKYNITSVDGLARVGLKQTVISDNLVHVNPLHVIEAHCRPHDFCVVKFDVDNGNSGPTLEWGFLADLLQSTTLRLVDELHIELHFCYPNLGWRYPDHSAQQGLDVLRGLRKCGFPVHAWP